MTNQDILQETIIKKGIDFFKVNTKGYLDLAMRAGKTRISIEICRGMYSGKKAPVILIGYPDNKLKDVWKQELEKWDYSNCIIDFCNFSSLSKYQKEGYDLFICDEFHSLSENEANIVKDINAVNQLFLSGTISSETKQKWQEFKEIAKYSTLDGIQDGILADYKLTVHLVDLDNKTKVPNKKGKLVTEKQKYDALSYVIAKTRAQGKDTMFLALARNRLSLSSIGKIEYTKKLLKKLEDKRVLVFTGLADVADNLDIYSHHSKTDSTGLIAFMKGKINHLALAAMGKVGVTYPNLDSVILLNFTYNKEETSQILNRAIKLDYAGKIADLHVICLNEDAEKKKIQESLSMLDKSKIKYV